jgi:hypothetical protein
MPDQPQTPFDMVTDPSPEFVNLMDNCYKEMYTRPQIAKQYFYKAMDSMNGIDDGIGEKIEQELVKQHQAYGFSIKPRYLKD